MDDETKIERKPDMETESFRLWFTNDSQISTGKNIIKYKGMEFELCGFSIISSKETKEKLFAYKWKHERQMVLYHIFKECEDTARAIAILKLLSSKAEYSFTTVESTFDNIINEEEAINQRQRSNNEKKD